MEQNTQAVNPPGVYKDPKSGKSLEAQSEPQADALARLGWELQGSGASGSASEAVVIEGDRFTVQTTSRGQIQYRKNGRVIKKAEYDKAVTAVL